MGNLFQEMNHTNIVLIPKVKVYEFISQFRLISLCNFAYNIFSKLMTNQLKPYLPDLNFVTRRQIQDNFFVAPQVFHYLKHKKLIQDFELGLKVDMNKAYDRVEWDFLEAVLLRLGFQTRWVSTVITYIRTILFFVTFNS